MPEELWTKPVILKPYESLPEDISGEQKEKEAEEIDFFNDYNNDLVGLYGRSRQPLRVQRRGMPGNRSYGGKSMELPEYNSLPLQLQWKLQRQMVWTKNSV